eukprot:1393734-Amorphochlora_amoeboformis.AAC.1
MSARISGQQRHYLTRMKGMFSRRSEFAHNRVEFDRHDWLNQPPALNGYRGDLRESRTRPRPPAERPSRRNLLDAKTLCLAPPYGFLVAVLLIKFICVVRARTPSRG